MLLLNNNYRKESCQLKKGFLILSAALIGSGCFEVSASEYCKSMRQNPLEVGDVISDIYWSDADSGRANKVCFRVANADAAETGPIGSFGGAKCEKEREVGYQSKAYAIERARGTRMVVTGLHGFDNYDRQMIDMSSDGLDWVDVGLSAGIYKRWIFKNGRKTMPKPLYCN